MATIEILPRCVTFSRANRFIGNSRRNNMQSPSQHNDAENKHLAPRDGSNLWRSAHGRVAIDAGIAWYHLARTEIRRSV